VILADVALVPEQEFVACVPYAKDIPLQGSPDTGVEDGVADDGVADGETGARVGAEVGDAVAPHVTEEGMTPPAGVLVEQYTSRPCTCSQLPAEMDCEMEALNVGFKAGETVIGWGQ